MFFTLILENQSGEQINMTTTANQYLTAKIDGLNPPAGRISTSTYAGIDGSYLNNAFIAKRNVVISFQMRGIDIEKRKVSEILSSLDTYNSTITQLNNHVTELQNRLAEVEAVTGATGVILVSAGQIGSTAFYALYSDGTLRINGSGSTYSYTGLNNSIFYMNSNIKKIIVSSGITALGDFLFESCDNIKTVSLASTVTSIGASAFSSTGLEEITIPASVKSIGEYAFKGTKITDITIPESVTSMGYYIFSSCMKLKTVKINGSVISSYTFAFCYALSNLTISVNCKSIGSNIISVTLSALLSASTNCCQS